MCSFDYSHGTLYMLCPCVHLAQPATQAPVPCSESALCRCSSCQLVSQTVAPYVPSRLICCIIKSITSCQVANFVRTAFHSCEESLRPRSCRGIYIHSDNGARLSLLHTTRKPNRREGRTPSFLGATSRVHRRSLDATNIFVIAKAMDRSEADVPMMLMKDTHTLLYRLVRLCRETAPAFPQFIHRDYWYVRHRPRLD